MKRGEAIELLELIQDLYPRYSLSKEKAKMLIQALTPMDYEGVKDNLSVYVATHPYAPTVAEIAAYPLEENELLNQLDVWRAEANEVPEETKQHFHHKIQRLIAEVTYV